MKGNPKDTFLPPKGTKDESKKFKFLLKSAAILSSVYAYYRQLLPKQCFVHKKLHGIEVPLFNDSDPAGKRELEAFQNLYDSLVCKQLHELYFAACEDKNGKSVVECLRFEFYYKNISMDVVLPNDTVVIVENNVEFAASLDEIVYKIRMICGMLGDFERKVYPTVICTFAERRYSLQPISGYRVESYEEVTGKLDILPIAKIPIPDGEGAMSVEIRSKYFLNGIGPAVKDIQKHLLMKDVFNRDFKSVSRHNSEASDRPSVSSADSLARQGGSEDEIETGCFESAHIIEEHVSLADSLAGQGGNEDAIETGRFESAHVIEEHVSLADSLVGQGGSEDEIETGRFEPVHIIEEHMEPLNFEILAEEETNDDSQGSIGRKRPNPTSPASPSQKKKRPEEKTVQDTNLLLENIHRVYVLLEHTIMSEQLVYGF